MIKWSTCNTGHYGSGKRHSCRIQIPIDKTIALSSVEDNYMAMAMAMLVQERIWVMQLLQIMGHPFDRPIQQFVDNHRAIAIAIKKRWLSYPSKSCRDPVSFIR